MVPLCLSIIFFVMWLLVMLASPVLLSSLGVILNATVRLLFYDLEVMCLNLQNNLSACGGKIANIYPPKTPLGGSVVHWVAIFFSFLFYYNFYGFV